MSIASFFGKAPATGLGKGSKLSSSDSPSCSSTPMSAEGAAKRRPQGGVEPASQASKRPKKFSGAVSSGAASPPTSQVTAVDRSEGGGGEGEGSGGMFGGPAYMHSGVAWLDPQRTLRDMAGVRYGEPNYNPRTLLYPKSCAERDKKGARKAAFTTPAMVQWWAVKERNFDTVLMFKIGKFYELFNMDAEVGCHVLGLLMMPDHHNSPGKAHCGFPEMAYAKYAQQLVSRGYRVARVEQVESKEEAQERNRRDGSGTTVQREVVSKATPGVVTDPDLSLDYRPQYLLSVCESSEGGGAADAAAHSSTAAESTLMGVCLVDSTTGAFFVGSFSDDSERSRFATMLSQVQPAEVIFGRGSLSHGTRQVLKSQSRKLVQTALLPKQDFWAPDETIRQLAGESDKHNCTGYEYFPGQESRGSVEHWPETLRELALSFQGEGDAAAQLRAATALQSVGGCVSYLRDNLVDTELVSMKNFSRYSAMDERSAGAAAEAGGRLAGQHMVLDSHSLVNLEILVGEAGERRGSLLEHLDYCSTPFGKRMLERWLVAPLCDPSAIVARLDAIDDLEAHSSLSAKAQSRLRKLPDLERLMSNIHAQGIRTEEHPIARAVMYSDVEKKMVQTLDSAIQGFRAADKLIASFQDASDEFKSPLLKSITTLGLGDGSGSFPKIGAALDDLDGRFVIRMAEKGTPASVMPKPGSSVEYEEAQAEVEAIKERLEEYRQEMDEKYGTRCKYICKGATRYLLQVPGDVEVSERWERKGQSGKGHKLMISWTNDTLVQLEGQLDDADSIVAIVCGKAVQQVFVAFDESYPLFSRAVRCLAQLDTLLSLRLAGRSSGSLPVCRPTFVEREDDATPMLRLTKAWHPVVAKSVGDDFIPNDMQLAAEQGEPPLLVLTGPNMGGKSTFLRQSCIAVIMAQVGCYVPAESCTLSPVDRIFTRMGADDNIMGGASTFFVELSEASVTLQNATRDSLVVMDELGRGTSTFDGVAIAYAVARHLSREVRCRTLFTTHYHSLMSDFARDDAMALGHMKCLVDADDTQESDAAKRVTMLYTLAEGACPRSYGLNVARRAGIPDSVIRRSAEKSEELEAKQTAVKHQVMAKQIAAELGSWDLSAGVPASAVALATRIREMGGAE